MLSQVISGSVRSNIAKPRTIPENSLYKPMEDLYQAKRVNTSQCKCCTSKIHIVRSANIERFIYSSGSHSSQRIRTYRSSRDPQAEPAKVSLGWGKDVDYLVCGHVPRSTSVRKCFASSVLLVPFENVTELACVSLAGLDNDPHIWPFGILSTNKRHKDEDSVNIRLWRKHVFIQSAFNHQACHGP